MERTNGNSTSGVHVIPSFQLGSTDLWIDAGADASVLGEARAAGLKLVSDGVRPRHHPAHGEAEAESWSSFWLAAAEAGLKGNATVLFGPAHDLDSVLDQLEAIARVQHACGVFMSLAPVIYDPQRPEGSTLEALTQGRQDLQIFALSRVCGSGIEHLRMLYACSDLKMAHLTLASGVDDLEGHLFDGKRTPRETADTFDMNLDEIEAWMSEAGYEPVLRNGIFEDFPRERDEA
jgi:2-iminoacetate synthase ThiH